MIKKVAEKLLRVGVDEWMRRVPEKFDPPNLRTVRANRRRIQGLVKVGIGTYGHEGIHIHRWDLKTSLIIGNFCSIADRVHVFLGGARFDCDFYFSVLTHFSCSIFCGK